MLKYTNMGNFKPIGEIGQMFSHIYQFVENKKLIFGDILAVISIIVVAYLWAIIE